MTALSRGATERDMTSLRQSVAESGVTANVATYPDYCQTLTITGRFRILLSNITAILLIKYDQRTYALKTKNRQM